MSTSGRELRRRGATVVQLAGALAVAVGFGLLVPWAGFVAGGVCLVAFGVAAEVT